MEGKWKRGAKGGRGGGKMGEEEEKEEANRLPRPLDLAESIHMRDSKVGREKGIGLEIIVGGGDGSERRACLGEGERERRRERGGRGRRKGQKKKAWR